MKGYDLQTWTDYILQTNECLCRCYARGMYVRMYVCTYTITHALRYSYKTTDVT